MINTKKEKKVQFQDVLMMLRLLQPLSVLFFVGPPLQLLCLILLLKRDQPIIRSFCVCKFRDTFFQLNFH